MPIKITHCPRRLCVLATFRWCEMSSVSTPVYVTVIHILRMQYRRQIRVCIAIAIAIQVKLSAAFDDRALDWLTEVFVCLFMCKFRKRRHRSVKPFTMLYSTARAHTVPIASPIILWSSIKICLQWQNACPSESIFCRLDSHRRIGNDDDSFQYWLFFFPSRAGELVSSVDTQTQNHLRMLSK